MYILVAILIFGVLIFVHELGHFLTAKRLDVQVNEFSVCMGPAIVQTKRGETTYSLRCIPIGGFCAMEGENEESENPRAFTSKPWWRRLLILAAGSAANFLTGLLVLVILFSTMSAFAVPRIDSFMDGCPLESESGLQVGDEFYRIDGRRVFVQSDVSMLFARNTTGRFDLVLRRNGKLIELHDFEMQPRIYLVDGAEELRYGLYFGTEEKTFGTVLREAWNSALDFVRLVWMGLEDLVTGLVSINEMSGPVGIVSVIAETGDTAETTQDAVLNIAYLAAFIAVNLAVMNLLPLPALDGGRIFLLLVGTLFTTLTKKKIPSRYEAYVHAAGMVALLAFMAFVTFKDIWRLIA